MASSAWHSRRAEIGLKTDHSAITIEFQSTDQQLKGPRSWKLNVSLVLKTVNVEEM